MMLESILGIEPETAREQRIRPLQDVWLRPRRVFRELAAQPIGRIDFLLGAAQGMVSWLALSRTQNAGATAGVAEILGKGLCIGSLFGIVSMYMMAEVYTRLGKRVGGAATRRVSVSLPKTCVCSTSSDVT